MGIIKRLHSLHARHLADDRDNIVVPDGAEFVFGDDARLLTIRRICIKDLFPMVEVQDFKGGEQCDSHISKLRG